MLIYEIEVSLSRGDFVVFFIIEISPGVKILLLSTVLKEVSLGMNVCKIRIKVYMYRYLLAINVVFYGVLQAILKKRSCLKQLAFSWGWAVAFLMLNFLTDKPSPRCVLNK